MLCENVVVICPHDILLVTYTDTEHAIVET